MVKYYANQIKLGKIQIENVPEKWRKEVEEVLKNED